MEVGKLTPEFVQGEVIAYLNYLAKPFQKEELLVRLEQLMELRRQLQGKYQTAE